jgi:hypothetical protein
VRIEAEDALVERIACTLIEEPASQERRSDRSVNRTTTTAVAKLKEIVELLQLQELNCSP